MKCYKYISTVLIVGFLSFCATPAIFAQSREVSALIKKARKAGIEQKTLTELQSRAQEQGMNDNQLKEIIQTAISMSEENLPANVAIQKSLEGLSKGIPANRIISVVGSEHQSMREAVKIVDPWMRKAAVQNMLNRKGQSITQKSFRNELAKATSKSIMQNTSPNTIKNVLSKIGDVNVLSHTAPSDVIAAMGILPDLPVSANKKETGNFVVRALRGGFKADDLQQLPSAMKMAQQRGQLPAGSVLEGVAKQMNKGVPARQIIQNLFNGKIGGGPPGNKPKGLGHKQNHGNSNGS